MQKFVELLTDDQKDKLKNCYMVTQDNELYKLTQDKGDELTTENFKVLFATEEGFLIATMENIGFYAPENGDYDFYVGDNGDYFSREDTPEYVVEFLDKVLNKAQYENKQ